MDLPLIYVEDYEDAIVLFEAIKIGKLNMVKERPSFSERLEIQSGDLFIYDETITGIKRWTDGMSWTSGRLNEGFFHYVRISSISDKYDLDKKMKSSLNDSIILRKKTISLINREGHVLHLVNYFNFDSIIKGYLKRPKDLDLISLNNLSTKALNYKPKIHTRSSSIAKVDIPPKNHSSIIIDNNTTPATTPLPLPQLKLSESESKNLKDKLYDEDRRQKDLLKPYISF